MTGRFIAVVGPSGVGKDSVMEGLAAADPTLCLARRVISRPATLGGEAFDGVSERAFRKAEDDGAFILSWHAHGWHYGIPQSVALEVAQGSDVLVNLSRAVLPQAQALFARFCVILLRADRDILAARLTARNREDAAEIERRLARADFAMPLGIPHQVIDNSGPLAQTIATIRQHLSQTACDAGQSNQKMMP